MKKPGMTIDRVEDGEIASSRDEHDIMGVMRQPGGVPAPEQTQGTLA